MAPDESPTPLALWTFGRAQCEHYYTFAAEPLPFSECAVEIKRKSLPLLSFSSFSLFFFSPSELQSKLKRDGCSESVTHLSGADNSGNPKRQAAAQSGEDGPS